MADLQSERFIRDNITTLETIRGGNRLSSELYRTITSLLDDWHKVESIAFRSEPKYANSPLKPLMKEPTNRSGQDASSVRPGNLQINSNHGYTAPQPHEDIGIWPRKRTDPLQNRSPQLPPRMYQGQHQELTHPSVNRPLPSPPNIPDRRGLPPSSSEEIKRYLSSEKEKTANTPYYMNTLSNPSQHPNNTERRQTENCTEIHNRDWSYQNLDTTIPTTAIPPIEVTQLEQPRYDPDSIPQTQRPGMAELHIFAEENTIIHSNEATEYYNHPLGPVVDKEITTHNKRSGTYPRERPPFPPPDDNCLLKPGQNDDQSDRSRVERSNSIDVLGTGELKPQLPPRRKSVEVISPRQRMPYESKPGDPEYANWIDTHSHNHNLRRLGNGVTFFDSTDRDPTDQNDNETQEDSWRSENEPLKTSDDYIMVFSSLEEAKPTQYREEKEEDRLAVFNLRELINEKTELHTEHQGSKRRRVIIEKTYTHKEIEFYDLISNNSIFYLYLSEHNILIQELISLEQPLGKVLREKLSTFYNIDFGKSIITLGAQIGLLEVNSRMNASLQKIENLFKKIYTRGKTILDPRLSLHQSNITTSHLICISQQDSMFDKHNFVTYLQYREMNSIKQFQRLFVPLIQGTVPLRKDEIKGLISHLIVIYDIKDWEMLIPEIYRKDHQVKSDIEGRIGLLYNCSLEEVIPQVTELVKDCKLRDSVYFYVKINNKDKKLNDAVLGVSTRNIHLISVGKNCEIELAYMWGLGDLETWKPCERNIVMKFKDRTELELSSPEQSEELIHIVLKSAIEPKKYLFAN